MTNTSNCNQVCSARQYLAKEIALRIPGQNFLSINRLADFVPFIKTFSELTRKHV